MSYDTLREARRPDWESRRGGSGLRLYVWRAWDSEWVAECNACGEIHWQGGWMTAMYAAWGHLAMRHGGNR